MRDPRYNLFIKYMLAILLPMLAVVTLYVDVLMENPDKETPPITAMVQPPPPAEIIFLRETPVAPKSSAKKSAKKIAAPKKAAQPPLSSKKAEDLVIKSVSEKVGISPKLVDAILTTETQRGKIVGKKNMLAKIPYDQRKPLIAICDDLGYKPNCVPLAPKGEMGPAQFRPTTWQMFEGKISDLTGHDPPDPWKFEDAAAAAALYLEHLGAKEDEKIAVQKYNAGSKWRTHGRPYLAKILLAKKKSKL